MKLSLRGASVTVFIAAATLAFTACATPNDTPGGIMDVPAAQPSPSGSEVIGQGTVIEQRGESVQLCLGPMTMIYPPDCGGPEVVGWDWTAVDGAETVGGTTFGTYAVQGTWDGERLTLAQPPIMLALYDPMVTEDPYTDPANPGETPDDELARIQTELSAEPWSLATYPENGYLFVEVIHDDGTLQSELDSAYGADVVVVRSQLRAVS